ncbi:MAG: TetM/TetW/TetO/TetS family tetracycline resistance ribosomal protection protein [Lachnospiraceae bacterium]|nr:TetM/TetW/TetO/TetS family tetracycline resistance ribosomal protection protein [Lachnospiraceae bacterium]
MSNKHINLGLVAHVDAGKTTLSEALLFLTGQIRQAGRVDHMDSFMDTDTIERERGITIFSSQARIEDGDFSATLLDTPGHVDFSAEMERTLKVIDYAVLVINGTDGVQSHTRTLWKLLAAYRIPVFLFINKMDLPGTDREALMKSLKKELSEGCVDFTIAAPDELCEEIAVLQESLLNEYMETGHLSLPAIQATVSDRILFPCYFGSALKFEGVEGLIAGLKEFTLAPSYPDVFAAKVYKIGRDPKGVRLTFLKLTGGRLKVKDLVSYSGTAANLSDSGNSSSESGHKGTVAAESADGDLSAADFTSEPADGDPSAADFAPEKVDQIRLYSGDKYTTVGEITAGEICAVTGLSHTCPGMGLGQEASDLTSMLEPVMTYQLLPPADVIPIQMAEKCRQLTEEDPLLHIEWNEELKELHVRLMGEVQLEVLTRRIWDRFGIHVAFGPGDIIYKETIARPVEGVGHFEPLRHYAEVHVLIEPGEPGSGIQVSSACSTDVLDGTKQRMIAMHLKEHEHRGVLTGSVLTDVKFTILTGRAHPKHTQGGDFRKATWRAVRHGLKCTESVLLEPYYRFTLDLPTADVGRAITDLDRRFSHFGTPEYTDPAANGTQMSRITGTGPVSTLWDYAREVHSYTNGIGSMACELSGYDVCHNSEEVIEKRAYDSEADTKNPTGSVFCAHGAGFPVPWYDVVRFMHLPPAWCPDVPRGQSAGQTGGSANGFSAPSGGSPDNFGNRPNGSAGGSDRRGGSFPDYSPEDIPDTFIDGSPRNLQSGTFRAGNNRPETRSAGAHGVSDSVGAFGSPGSYSDGYAYRTEGRSFSSSPEPKRKNWENKVASMSEVALEAELADVYAREFGMSITDLQAERLRRGDSGGIGRKNKPTGTKVKHDRDGNPIYPKQRQGEEYLIVDGYNVIFAWEDLRELSKGNIDAARDRLNDILLNYQAWRKIRVLVVYDAYRVKGGAGHTEVYAGKAEQDIRKQKEKPGIDTTDGIIIAFTKADETADAFIERTVNELGKKYRVTVVSGDGLIQLTILSLGALRMTAANLRDEIERSQREIRQKLKPGDEAVTRIAIETALPKPD